MAENEEIQIDLKGKDRGLSSEIKNVKKDFDALAKSIDTVNLKLGSFQSNTQKTPMSKIPKLGKAHQLLYGPGANVFGFSSAAFRPYVVPSGPLAGKYFSNRGQAQRAIGKYNLQRKQENQQYNEALLKHQSLTQLRQNIAESKVILLDPLTRGNIPRVGNLFAGSGLDIMENRAAQSIYFNSRLEALRADKLARKPYRDMLARMYREDRARSSAYGFKNISASQAIAEASLVRDPRSYATRQAFLRQPIQGAELPPGFVRRGGTPGLSPFMRGIERVGFGSEQALDWLRGNRESAYGLGLGRLYRQAKGISVVGRALPQIAQVAVKNPYAASAVAIGYGGYKATSAYIGTGVNLGRQGIGNIVQGLTTPFQTLSNATRTLISNFLVFSGVMYGLQFIIKRLADISSQTLEEAYNPINEKYRFAAFMGSDTAGAKNYAQNYMMGLSKGGFINYRNLGADTFELMAGQSDLYSDPRKAASIISAIAMLGNISGSNPQQIQAAIGTATKGLSNNLFLRGDVNTLRDTNPKLYAYMDRYAKDLGYSGSLPQLMKTKEFGAEFFNNMLAKYLPEIIAENRAMPFSPERMRSTYQTAQASRYMERGGFIEAFGKSDYNEKLKSDIEFIAQKSVDFRLSLLQGVMEAYKFFSDHRDEISGWLGNLGKWTLESFKTYASSIASALWGAFTWGAGKSAFITNLGAGQLQTSLAMLMPTKRFTPAPSTTNTASWFFAPPVAMLSRGVDQTADIYGYYSNLPSLRQAGKSFSNMLTGPVNIMSTNFGMADQFRLATDAVYEFVRAAAIAETDVSGNSDNLKNKAQEMVDTVWKAGENLVNKFREVAANMLDAITNAAVAMTSILSGVLNLAQSAAGAVGGAQEIYNKGIDLYNWTPGGAGYNFGKAIFGQEGTSALKADPNAAKLLEYKLGKGVTDTNQFIKDMEEYNKKTQEWLKNPLSSTPPQWGEGIAGAVIGLKSIPGAIGGIDPNINAIKHPLDDIAGNTRSMNDKMSALEKLLQDITRDQGLRKVDTIGTITYGGGGMYGDIDGIVNRSTQTIWEQQQRGPAFVVAEGYN